MRGCYVRPGHMLSDLSYTLGTRPLMNDVPHEEEGLHDTEVERQVPAKRKFSATLRLVSGSLLVLAGE